MFRKYPTRHPYVKKINHDTDFTSSIKITSKWIINLNVQRNLIKLLESEIGVLDDLEYSHGFLDITLKDVIHERNN